MSTPRPSLSSQSSTQSTQSFRVLEYYTPPKAVRHHIRTKSSALFTPHNKIDGTAHSFVKLEENSVVSEKGEMAFNTLNGLAGRMKGGHTSETILMSESTTQRGGAVSHAWWNMKHWGKKGWLILAGVVIIIVIIIAVAVTQVNKANAYPEYTKLTYSLAENC